MFTVSCVQPWGRAAAREHVPGGVERPTAYRSHQPPADTRSRWQIVGHGHAAGGTWRSEERRVGKASRQRGAQWLENEEYSDIDVGILLDDGRLAAAHP